MPSTMSFAGTLRRVSTAAAIRRPSKASTIDVDPRLRCERPQQQTVTPAVGLLMLPAELLGQILSQATFDDLCSMRSVNRDARQLLSEGDVLRSWMNQNLGDAQLLKLYPPPARVTFSYVSSLLKRYCIAVEVAALYTEYIERKIVRHSLMRLTPYLRDAKLHEDFRDVADTMRNNLVPLLITVQHYLECCAKVGLELVDLYNLHGSSLMAQYRVREREVLQAYESTHLLRVYKFWHFLAWLHHQLYNPPSYAGSFERAVRGWTASPTTLADLDVLTIFGNIKALGQLMRNKSFKDRQKAVEDMMRQLDPMMCTSWQQHWASFGLEYGCTPTKLQVVRALALEPSQGDVFTSSARSVLEEQDMLFPDSMHEEVDQGIEWVFGEPMGSGGKSTRQV
ncbi:hypothetical protein LTR53_001696 [Teratosphaeriaceae sp. CCFEE 6253]|nr:hypothetical protein LTR53_001696 [Teratosphaeriaceae sp. CCFEE 6253]